MADCMKETDVLSILCDCYC